MKAEILLLTSLLLAGACTPPADTPDAPEPIGEELLRFTTALGLPECAEAHLYRAREAVQYQCFAADGSFSWENRGALSKQGELDLEAALAAADLSNTAPSQGEFCNEPESDSATLTLWVGSDSVSYPPGCPIQGAQALHDVAMLLLGDIGDCIELDVLASVGPGCRAY